LFEVSIIIIVILFSCFYALKEWAKQWANLTSHCPSSDGSKSGKKVTRFGHGLMAVFQPNLAKVQIFFKALQAGLTNPRDISDSFTVTLVSAHGWHCDDFGRREENHDAGSKAKDPELSNIFPPSISGFPLLLVSFS
jgi:hypothetical protein